MNRDNGDNGPLSSEALKRDEWRRDASGLKPEDAPGHSLPASEDNTSDEDRTDSRPNPLAGTMLPPD